jgi:ATP-binding cassette, subfamily B, bacterial
LKPFPHYLQPDSKDCGPTCLKIVTKHYGKTIGMQTLRNLSETTREGSNLLTLSEAAESLGFRTLGVKISLEKLTEAPLPCILHWNKNHYVVLASLNSSKGGKFNLFKRFFSSKNNVAQSSPFGGWGAYISDPAHGLIEYTQEQFLKFWIGNNATIQTEEGIALLL